MGALADPDRLRQIQHETVAAIDQWVRLAHEVRPELIRLVGDGLICRDGAAEALHRWGFEPMPRVWTALAEGRLWYQHTGPDHPGGHALYERVLDAAQRALPAVSLRVGQATGPHDSDQPDRPAQLMVPAMLRIEVTTGDQDRVLAAARQLVHDAQPALADSGITLTDLAWSTVGEPVDLDAAGLLDYVGTPPEPPPVRLPERSTDLGTATRDRDTAIRLLDMLRRRVRARALRVVLDNEIGADLQEAADILEPILIRLGLGALPRAHQVTVTADLTLRVPADTADRAFATAYDVMHVFVERSDRAWRWQRSGCTRTASPPSDGGHWLVPWRLAYTTPVRGHLDPAAATAAAEAALRTALATTLGAAIPDVTVTATSHGFGIDPYANPRTD